jgi:hypothetical protein
LGELDETGFGVPIGVVEEAGVGDELAEVFAATLVGEEVGSGLIAIGVVVGIG